MPNRLQVRADARSLLQWSHVSPYLFTLLFLAVSMLLQGVSTIVSGSYITVAEQLSQLLQIELPIQLEPVVTLPRLTTTFIGIACSLFITVLSQGYTLYHMGIRRGETKGYDTLLDGFTFVGKIVAVDILTNLMIIGGLCLFLVPGIIFAYRFSFALYNLCENPELDVLEALNMSARQTRGYKMELFLLDLSFIGWLLLTALTAGVLSIWIRPWIIQSHLTYFAAAKKSSGIGAPVPRDSDTPMQDD